MEVWVLIPIVAILGGTITEWVKIREKHRRLGADNSELERKLEALEKELADQRERSERRIGNLETIVTSRTWEQLSGTTSPSKKEVPAEWALPPLPPEEPSDEEKVRRLARHLET